MDPNLLGIVLLGFGGGLIGLLGIFRSSWLKSWAFRCAPLALAVAAGAVALTGDTPALAWLPLALAAFWVLVMWGDQLVIAANRMLGLLRHPVVACGIVLVAGPALAVWWSYAATSKPEYWIAPTDFEAAELGQIQKTRLEHELVRTDAGRIVEVKAPARAATPDELDVVNSQPTPDTIRTEGAGVDYNCHGWIFSGGRYWIGGREVQAILDDNGYYPVDCPEPGDIVVYRNRDNEILHTGLVRVADEWGILIESKWGARGRYVHTPENQGYSLQYNYYRSGRGSHLLAGVNSMAATQTVSTPGISDHVR